MDACSRSRGLRQPDHLRLRPWPLIVASALLALSSFESGSASSLTVTGSQLGSGAATIARCDADGVAYRYASDSSGTVLAVSVSGIDLACAGGNLQLTLVAGTTSIGQGNAVMPTVGFAGAAIVTIDEAPAASQVSGAHIAIEGP